MQNFKGAIFDMDGTLLDSMPGLETTDTALPRAVRRSHHRRGLRGMRGFSQPQVAGYFLKRYPNLPLTQQQMLDGMDEMITSRYETIARPKDGVIDFSFIGYKPQSLAVMNRTEINVTMEEDATMIGEVVAIGYGSQRKEDLSMAVTTVKLDEAAKAALEPGDHPPGPYARRHRTADR